MKAVNTMLIGCGAVAQRLYRKPLRALEKQGIVRVTGLVDVHVSHAESMRRSFPGACTFDNLERAFQKVPCELALVLSPSQLHAQHALLALHHGSHVLCEKPMATTEAECEKMVALANDLNRVLAIGMIRRFIPSFAQLKHWIANQDLGEIRSFSYREGRRFDWDVMTAAGFRGKGDGGSGVLLDIGPHAIDALTWLFGSLEVISYADDALAGVESTVVMEVESRCGRGVMQLSWDFPLANELRVIGSKCEAVLRLTSFDRLGIKTSAGFREHVSDYSFPADIGQPVRKMIRPRLYTQSMYCQLIQVVRAIRLNERPAVTGEEGKTCVNVIESARCCAEPIDMPWLEHKQRESFRSRHWTRAR